MAWLDQFLDYVCPLTPVLALGFSLALLFAIVSVLFALSLPETSGSYYIALITIPIDGFVLVCTGGLLHLCGRHQD